MGKYVKSTRHIRNWALQPRIQVKTGAASILTTILFAAIAIYLVYFNLADSTEVVLNMTGLPDEVKQAFRENIQPLKLEMIGLTLVYVGVNLMINFKLTHQMVGPTIAFRRHIQEIITGNLNHRTRLRKSDAFGEVADDLNRLSQHLQDKGK